VAEPKPWGSGDFLNSRTLLLLLMLNYDPRVRRREVGRVQMKGMGGEYE
jgi:hypothetical protein